MIQAINSFLKSILKNRAPSNRRATTCGAGADDPLIRTTAGAGGGSRYYHADGLGSIVAVTDDYAVLKGAFHYSAWGNRTSVNGAEAPVFSFAGREASTLGADSSSNNNRFVYMRARYYLPGLGRFSQPDPLGYVDGINRYAYVRSSPINYVDPTGLLARRNALTFNQSYTAPIELNIPSANAVAKYNGAIAGGYSTTCLMNCYTPSPTERALNTLAEYTVPFYSLAKSIDDNTRSINGWDLAGALASMIPIARPVTAEARALLGAGKASTEEMARVGRWMSQTEYGAMKATQRVQESFSGTTHVASPADASAFMKQAAPLSFYVEFNVPTSSLKSTGDGWAKIIGPNSLEGRLAARKGLPIPQMPEAADIFHAATKLP